MVKAKGRFALLLWGITLLGCPPVLHAQIPTVTLTVPDGTAAEAGRTPPASL
jgi:hypothetical protein